MSIRYAFIAGLVALAPAAAVAQVSGTSIGTTQGSTQEAGPSGGNPTSEEAARTAAPRTTPDSTPSAGSARSPVPSGNEGRAASAGISGAAPHPCAALSSPEREKCIDDARASGGTSSGLGGSADRVGPGSTGMGR